MNTNNTNAKQNKKITKMIRAIQTGNNIDAYKCLEDVIKERVANKIDSALVEK